MFPRSTTRPRRQNSRRADADRRCPRFLQWVRSRQCALHGKKGHVCEGKIEACHVDYAGDKGMGLKVADRFAVPICAGGHRQQHAVGWTNFESLWRYSGLEHANNLWRHWSERTAAGVDWRRSQAEGEVA